MTFHPAIFLLLGALLVPLCHGRLRSVYVIALPVLAFVFVAALPEKGEFWQVTWLAGFEPLTFLRVDKLSKAFAYIFTINATVAFIYAFYVREGTQQVSALLYIGSALGAVFAGDLITLYIFWEIMAVTSTMLILARRSSQSNGAAFRYVLLHILGGLFFLAGVVLTFHSSGSLAFDSFDPAAKDAGSWLILLGFLVNAAVPPFSAWLSDAYPEATITGAVILSAYTTKTAIYALLRGFPGWEILIVAGCIMAVYGIIYALIENDVRRILAYTSINQGGFMVCAVGIGSAICLDGAVAHAFSHIIYKSLLWMSAGAVLYRLGLTKCTDLGGLYRSMPWTFSLTVIAALSISALPLTSGFTSKTMILEGAAEAHLFWPWLILEIASAGVLLHAGIKFPYFIFFGKDRGHEAKEAPRAMLVAMGILAFFCLFLGIYPQPLYSILPHAGAYEFGAWKLAKVITQMQLLLLSALTFFVWLKLLKPSDSLVLDTDWFYRKGGRAFYRLADLSLNSLNSITKTAVVDVFVKRLTHFLRDAPARLLVAVASPFWIMDGLEGEALKERQTAVYVKTRLSAFPIGFTAFLSVVLLALLFFI